MPVDARCPRCGRAAALRATPESIHWARQMEPEAVIVTYQCNRPHCKTVFPIRARDIGRAA